VLDYALVANVFVGKKVANCCQFFAMTGCCTLLLNAIAYPNNVHAKKCNILVVLSPKHPKRVDNTILGLNSWWSAVSHLILSMFAPVASNKNAGLAGKFDKILTHSFLFSA
jgi:hypothetical protein